MHEHPDHGLDSTRPDPALSKGGDDAERATRTDERLGTEPPDLDPADVATEPDSAATRLQSEVDGTSTEDSGDFLLVSHLSAEPTGATFASDIARRRRGALPQVPDYEVLSELGRGGMGVVYLARQVRLKRLCALKMILAGDCASAEEAIRFFREAETVAKLRHPEIIQVYHLGDCDGRPYLELEYAEGGSLAAKLGRRPIAAAEAARTIEALSRPVHAAHQAGVVHRDLKPGNILLTADGIAKVADFGLAKSLTADAGLTRTDATLGTPSYMAPEQIGAQGGVIGPPADIYSLGAILYELMTGRPPFQAASRWETLEQVRTADPVPPSRLVPGLPRDLETICLKCLEKDPGRRYPTAAELGADLARFLAHEPIHARPAAPWERVAKWVRRRPVPATLTGALFVAICSLVCGGLWSYDRIRVALVRSEADQKAALKARNEESIARHQESIAHQKAVAARNDAIEARDKALALTYDVLASETRTLRHARSPGWRSAALANLRQLALLETPRRDVLALRAEAAACLSGLDVRVTARLEGMKGVWSLDFSPDGTQLAAAGVDNRVHVFETANGRIARAWSDPDRGSREMYTKSAPWPAVRFRPNGTHAAITTWGQGLALLDLAAGAQPQRLIAADGRPRAVAFDGRGALVAVAWSNRRAGVYDAATGAKRLEVEVPADANQLPVALSPDGTRFAAVAPGHAIHLATLNGSARSMLRGHIAPVRSLAFSPDGLTLASAAEDGAVTLWDVPRGEARIRLAGHTAAANGVVFSPEGELLATVGDDTALRLWDVRTGHARAEYRPEIGPLTAVSVAPGGDRLAIACDTVLVLSLEGRRERRSLKGHTYEVVDLASHPSEPWLASVSQDQHVVVWDWRTGRARGRWKVDPDRPLETVAASPDGRLLATGTGEYAVHRLTEFPLSVWSFGDLSGTPVRRFAGPSAPPSTMAFDPASRFLVTGDRDGEIQIWDIASGEPVRRIRYGSPSVRALAIIGDPPALLVGQGRTLRLHAFPGGQSVREVDAGAEIYRFAVNSDGRRVCVADAEGTLRLYALPELELLQTRRGEHAGAVTAVAFGDGGRLLASAGDDHRVVARDGETLEPRLALPAHDGTIHQLAFDPSGTLLAVAGVEIDVTVWDVAALRRGLSTLGLDWEASTGRTPVVPSRPAPAVVARVEAPSPERIRDAWHLMSIGETRRWEKRPDEALEAYQRALAIWQAVAADSTVDPFYRSELAVTHAAIALLDHRAGRDHDGARQLRAACVLVESLRTSDPRVAFALARVRALGVEIGGADSAERRLRADRALLALRMALAAGYNDRRALERNPDLDAIRDRPEYRALLGAKPPEVGWPELVRQAEDALHTGKADEAVDRFAAARTLLAPLVADDSNNGWLRGQLASAMVRQGSALATAGRRGDAAGVLDEAATILGPRADGVPFEAWYALARAEARLGPERADACVSALRRAVAAGFRDRSALEADSMFDAVRDRPEFRALAVEMIFVDPFRWD